MEREMWLIIIGYLMTSICAAELIVADESTTEKLDAESVHNQQLQLQQEHNNPPSSFFTLPSFHLQFPQITMPQINFPQIRFPKFPEHIKKPFKKAKVTETTTVYIEVTKRVTRHPICVTAYLPKPPCLNNYYYDELRDVENDYEESYVQEEPKLAIEPTRVVELPTVRSTSNIEGAELISSSDEETVAVTDDLEQKSEDYNKRNARYLVPHPPLNFETDDEVEENGRIIKKDFLKNTHYVTKSIIVTKVEKTFDHRVTATLVAKNCIPSAPRFPHCGKFHHPIIGGGIHNNNNNKEWKDKEEEHENEQQSIKKANKSLNYQHSN